MWHLAEWARRLLSFLIRFDEQHLPLKVRLLVQISLVHLYVKLLHLTRYLYTRVVKFKATYQLLEMIFFTFSLKRLLISLKNSYLFMIEIIKPIKNG